MRKNAIRFIAVLLIVLGLFLLVKVVSSFIRPTGRGALQVTSNIKAQVFLNDKLLGSTPLCKCNQNETLKEGQYSVKIVPEDKSLSPFTAEIKINPGVQTVVDRTFLPGALASASILTLEKIDETQAQLLVASIPESALVILDSTPQGVTPFLLKTISPSEHELVIQKEGFNKKTIKIRAVNSYKLTVNAILGTQTQEELGVPTQVISPTPTPLQPTTVVRIATTPTGFLRVREEPATSAREIARVNPGEEFPYAGEQNGWYKIKLPNGGEGWVSNRYAEKINK